MAYTVVFIELLLTSVNLVLIIIGSSKIIFDSSNLINLVFASRFTWNRCHLFSYKLLHICGALFWLIMISDFLLYAVNYLDKQILPSLTN